MSNKAKKEKKQIGNMQAKSVNTSTAIFFATLASLAALLLATPGYVLQYNRFSYKIIILLHAEDFLSSYRED